jgi:hypothetical protein
MICIIVYYSLVVIKVNFLNIYFDLNIFITDIILNFSELQNINCVIDILENVSYKDKM